MRYLFIAALLLVTPAIAAGQQVLRKEGSSASVAIKGKLTVWPALSQREVNDITARAKTLAMGTAATGGGKPTLNIFCHDEAKCGNLALSFENAFESAKWTVAVRYTASMIPPGLLASPKIIETLATIDPHFGLGADPEPEAVESISIGERPDPKGWKE